MSAEEHSTALGLDIPAINRTGRMIRRPSTTIDSSQKVSSASSPHNVQMEIQDTPIYLDTREKHTYHDECDISNAIESSPHTPTADNLQNTDSLIPDSSINFYRNVLNHLNQENTL